MLSKLRKHYEIIIGTIGFGLLFLLTITNKEHYYFDISLFAILSISGILLESISIKIDDFTVTLGSAVMLGSYFISGLIPTLWLIFLVFMTSNYLYYHKQAKRAYFNIGMFFTMFILSHYIIKAAGRQINYINNIDDIINCIIFGLTIFIANWMIVLLQNIGEFNDEIANVIEALKWDFYTNFIVIPLSILMSYSYQQYSFVGLIVFILLIMTFNSLFRLMRNLIFINKGLSLSHQVSASIVSKLDLSETISNILIGIKQLVNCDYCALIEFDRSSCTAKTLDFNAEEYINFDSKIIDDYLTKHFEEILTLKESFVLEDVGKSKYIDDSAKVPEDLVSLIYEPLILDNEIIGCVLISSKYRGRFSKEQLYILDNLASQIVVAIENARLYKKVYNNAIKDELTGLYNQRYFFNALDSLTDTCSTCTFKNCIKCNKTSLIIFDIDHFKRINDTYGHQTGDKILSEIASIIRNNVRANDKVFRYGGEEFTVILPKIDQQHAYDIAERIRKVVENTKFYSVEGDEIKVTISGGLAEFPEEADSGASLLAYADRAMYIGAKKQGRNKISKYAASM
ncbi:sensor domain-containing diguanylate cyclase [Caloranaerobacter ferrireducens]|uniref:sensor domain-containing diguanylate cyclase n=1 Tax=Caloranaerobacter ferrireducens TaxID=1323370 RepID=UPI00084E029B|nr:sensor domain-containing diguanylate cyclase [Caloranaerobacter ferrireducens]